VGDRPPRWRLLTAYAHRTGAPNPDSYYIKNTEETAGNFTLGAWATSRRKEYRLGVLSPSRVAAWKRSTGGNEIRTTPPGAARLPTSNRPPTTTAPSPTSPKPPSSTEQTSVTG